MDEYKIVEMYKNGGYTLRHLADLFNTNHHMIKRILLRHDVKITRRNTLKEFSDDHKRKISETRKALFESKKIVSWQKGKKIKEHITKKGTTGIDLLYLNMQSHLRYKIDITWLKQFSDIEKLKFLNRSIARKRDFGDYTIEFYKSFITKFYYDKDFNKIYDLWISHNRDHLLKPSPDHIIPVCNDGEKSTIENIRFVTWFENRCKNGMSLEQWETVKANINDYFI